MPPLELPHIIDVFGYLCPQSALGSLRIFGRLAFFGAPNSYLGIPLTPVSSSSVHMSTHQNTGKETVGPAPRSQVTSTMGAQPSTDVTMTPASLQQYSNQSGNLSLYNPPVAAQFGRPSLAFTSLPDELIAMCYADLSASDLVALEHVSLRLHRLIAYDSVCWKRCTENRWGHLSSNSVMLAAAAKHAGTWKQLYSEKALSEKENTPWLTLCKSETSAILDIIRGENSAPLGPAYWPMMTNTQVTPSSPPEDPVLRVSSSPVSVMPGTSPVSSLSVVLLVDASSSVTDDDFDAMKSFARALVENLRQSHPESSVAVVQFNQHPKVEVPLTNVRMTKLSTSIENMEQLMGSTDIAAPIRRARQILTEDAGPGDRAIVLLTDGQTHADELQESEREARKASEEVGARLYTLGVGRDIDEVGLGRVAAGSEGGMHFTLRRLIPSK